MRQLRTLGVVLIVWAVAALAFSGLGVREWFRTPSPARRVRHWSSVTVVRCQLAFQSAPAHGFASPAAQRFRTERPKWTWSAWAATVVLPGMGRFDAAAASSASRARSRPGSPGLSTY